VVPVFSQPARKDSAMFREVKERLEDLEKKLSALRGPL
jgi:hypothetical protein